MADAPERLRAYLALRETQPRWFETPEGGMRIVTDPARILEIEAEFAARYAARGWPGDWAQVGICYRDPYLMVLRDAVLFLDGAPGIHHRTLRLGVEDSGVTILPMIDGKLLLLRHFRHPTRRWMWEFPRGAIEPGASPEATIAAEMREEIEGVVTDVIPLGRMYGASGFMGLGVLLYAARLASYGAPALGEGVAGARLVSIAEFEDMVRASEITDSFTLCAFLHARLRGVV